MISNNHHMLAQGTQTLELQLIKMNSAQNTVRLTHSRTVVIL